MQIDRLDHLVLTVADVERAVRFYVDVLGMQEVTFGEGRTAVLFGRQKINLHQSGGEVEPKAAVPTAGSAEFCFITTTLLELVLEELESKGAAIEMGLVERTGAMGKIRSIYLRDPDKNLIEISNY